MHRGIACDAVSVLRAQGRPLGRTPTFVKESSGLVEVLKVLQVCFPAEEVQVSDLRANVSR